MIYAFNIVIIFIILLIAYWWANQGFFSALLHLLCIIIAGVVALAVWEPLTVNYLLGIKGFGDYAWGVSLIGVFVTVALTLRIATNKLVPANVYLPQWANLVFGGLLGAVAGLFSVGIVMIGGGFMQSSTEIMGFEGMVRNPRNSQIPAEPTQKLWVPAHEWTYQALSLLSETSLSTRTPLPEYNPHLDYMAASLMRDSFRGGRGKVTLDPEDITVDRYQLTADRRSAAVTVTFRGAARDFGEQLTLSKSQIRLILDDGRAVHPFGWSQRTSDLPSAHFNFDDRSHYASSVPGADNATIMFKFNLSSPQDSYGGSGPGGTATPRFIQVRGTRFNLPRPGNLNPSDLRSGADLRTNNTSSAPRITGGGDISSVITQGARVRGLNISVNQISGMDTVEVDEQYFLSEGLTEVRPGGIRPGRRLRIYGIYEPPGTRVIQIDISRSSPANLFSQSLTDRTNEGDQIKLVDSTGLPYEPIGYVHRRPDRSMVVKLDPANGVPTMKDIPALPTSGDHELFLVFRVTEDITLSALMLGDVTVGTCNTLVETEI